MKGIKIKETYLLFLIVVGLVSLGIYTTYALFTASTEIEDVVGFDTSLSTNNSIVEYEMVTVPAGETKIIELNITNSYGSSLYYGAWYEMVSPSTINDDIEIGLYTDKNNTAGSGSIASGTTLNLLVGITNNTSSNVIINIGTVGSLTNNLGLASTRVLLPAGWSEALIVTDEVLAQYTGSRTDTVITERDYSWLSTSSISTSGKATLTLNPGTYKLEVWGAEGGYGYNNATTYAGGKGGYSYGTLTLTEETTAYVYVGGQGIAGSTTSSNKAGGYNGGGNSGRYRAGSGGGASDIRLGTDSLYARVIVAGGGQGARHIMTSSQNREFMGSDAVGAVNEGYAFGVGEPAYTEEGIANTGGGGGWYGGKRGDEGGGSGYVYTSSTASNYPSGCLLNSSYYLIDAAVLSGEDSFIDFNGTTATGHSGTGAVRITIIS